MKVIIVKNTYSTYLASVYGASKFKASATSGELSAARACAKKWYGEAAAKTVRQVTDPAELRTLIEVAHLPIVTAKDKTVFVFNEQAKAEAKKPRASTVKAEVLAPEQDKTGLPTLSHVAVAMGQTRDRLEEMATRYDRESLAERLWIGVCCLAAQERHSLDPKISGARGGKAKGVTRVEHLSVISPDEAHPQGFLSWIKNACPWLPQATAYKYMDAAKGANMTGWASEEEVRAWAGELLAKYPDLTLRSLVDDGRKLLPPPPTPPEIPQATRWEQMTFESLIGYAAQTEQIIACRPHMSPKQLKLASARAYEVLRELTGSPWAPADEDDADLISALEEARRTGI